MSSQSKLRQSRGRWKVKAVRRADDNRYLRKELARTKNERDRFKTDTKEYKAKLKQIEQQNKRPAVILIVQEFPFCAA